MATVHYAKNTQEFSKNSGFDFVEKNINPTNLPQCQPTEDYFGRMPQLLLLVDGLHQARIHIFKEFVGL